MIIDSRRDTIQSDATQRRHARAGSGPSAWLATLVLALATGTPLHSAANVLPHSGEQTTPYLGV